MQLLGSIQFIVATVRHMSQCSQIFYIFPRQRRILCSYADNFNMDLKSANRGLEFVLMEMICLDKLRGKFHLFLSLFHVAVCCQLLYTGVVIYAPALILNQGEQDCKQRSIKCLK